MDGLLVDSEPLWFRVEIELARDRGGDWTAAHAAQCVGRGIANTLETMRLALGLDIDLARDAEELIDRVIARAPEVALKPGARELMDDAVAARVPMALASSSPLRLIDAFIDTLDLRRSLQAVVSGEAVAHPKPAPDIFLLAASRLACDPARCVVLEDSVAGVLAGRAAGAMVIAVPEAPPPPGRYAAADAVAADLFEARRLLELVPQRGD
jgi:HAD superfamily hydrolase (TIGR01509 family)